MNGHPPSVILSPGQQKAAEILRRIIQLATGNSRQFLPLSTRTNTLIAGPSGCGKSHLVRMLAAEAGIPLWESNVSNWIVLGARNGDPTLESLSEWIEENHAGIIFLDEIEKISDSNAWYNSIRLELHTICDGIIPESVLAAVDHSEILDVDDALTPVRRKEMIKTKLQAKLRNSFLVIGAGTWQQEWTLPSETIGFQSYRENVCALDRRQMLRMISPEILQRFRHDVLFLEPMTHEDYLEVLSSQVNRLPAWQRDRFMELMTRAIPRALDDGLGMRIFEEVYTDLCLEIEPSLAVSSQTNFPVP